MMPFTVKATRTRAIEVSHAAGEDEFRKQKVDFTDEASFLTLANAYTAAMVPYFYFFVHKTPTK